MGEVAVTLISEDRVDKKDLDALRRAQQSGNQGAINSAKSIIRNRAKMTNMGSPIIRQVSKNDLPKYGKHLIDVGENCYVFNQTSLSQL